MLLTLLEVSHVLAPLPLYNVKALPFCAIRTPKIVASKAMKSRLRILRSETIYSAFNQSLTILDGNGIAVKPG